MDNLINMSKPSGHWKTFKFEVTLKANEEISNTESPKSYWRKFGLTNDEVLVIQIKT